MVDDIFLKKYHKYRKRYKQLQCLGGSTDSGLRRRRESSDPGETVGYSRQRMELLGIGEDTQQLYDNDIQELSTRFQEMTSLFHDQFTQQADALHDLQLGQTHLQTTADSNNQLGQSVKKIVKDNAQKLKDLVNTAYGQINVNNCVEMIRWKPHGLQSASPGESRIETVVRYGYNLGNRTKHFIRCIWELCQILFGLLRAVWSIYRLIWQRVRSLTNYKGYGSTILSPILFMVWAGIIVLDIFITYLLMKSLAGFVGYEKLFGWMTNHLGGWVEDLFRLILTYSKALVLWTVNKLEADFDRLFSVMSETFGRLYDILDTVILQDQEVGPVIRRMVEMFKRLLGNGISIIWNARCMLPPLSEQSSKPQAICGRERTASGWMGGCDKYPCWIPTQQSGGYQTTLGALSNRLRL